jgi:hypothetical protein
MLIKDIYGKTLSSSFQTAINAYSQKVKPKVVITFLDSRHIDNLTIATNDSYATTSKGTRDEQLAGNSMLAGYFFTPTQAINGIQRETFPWAIANEKDVYGKTIRADGNWYAMPSTLDDNYEFGWRSNAVSTSNAYVDGGYSFATSPYVEYSFTQRKVNKVRIFTSEFSGKINCYKVDFYNSTYSLFHTSNGVISKDEYYQDHIVPSSAATDMVNKIRVTVYSTQNPLDHARINEAAPLYQVDVTDYVINHSIDRTGELWENSIPIAGTGSSSASISLDNTSRDFNPFDSESAYGNYMKKDLKVNIYNGWRTLKTDEIEITNELKLAMNTSVTTMTLSDASFFPNGDSNNTFTVVIDPSTADREVVLCSTRTDKVITILQRGYAGTDAKTHALNAVVSFDPYEYVNGGEFYIDEWSGGSEMEVKVRCLDKTKYLTEKQITTGFYLQNLTVGDAIENLLMQTNISKNEFTQIIPYSLYSNKNAIASYSFASPVSRDEAAVTPGNGLRARVWKIESGKENEVKDIKADALDVQLSDYDKAMGAKAYIPPSYISYSTISTSVNGFSSNTSLAVNISNFSFTKSGDTFSEYYNGVIDGYYIPTTSGDQSFQLSTTSSGVRMFLDDTIVMNYWNNSAPTSSPRLLTSYDYMGRYLNLDANVPYKVRIEFYHAEGNVDSGYAFSLNFQHKMSGGSYASVPTTSCRTVIAEDSSGCRDVTFTSSAKNRNHYRNNGLYVSSPTIDTPSGLVSEPNNKSVLLSTTSSIKIPYDESLNLGNSASSQYTNEFTYELYVRFNNGAFTGDGVYLTNKTYVSSVNYGFSFFYNSSGHGFDMHTSGGNKVVSSNVGISTSNWYHICVTYKDSVLNYYHNGVLVDTETGVTASNFGLGNIDIGNSSKGFYIDEFAIYNKALDADTIRNRWYSTQIRPITVFPHLYGNDQSAKEIVDSISLADFGRFYANEEDKFQYNHFYRYFESVIAQHSSVQKTISSNSHIVSGDYNVQLQANKITISVTEQNPLVSHRQGLWTATPDPATLGVVRLIANIDSNDTTLSVSTTNDPPFPSSGYLKIDDEVMKYTSINSSSFLGLERGQFDTEATDHYINDLVREARYYEITYDNAPAFNIQQPFITAIANTSPAEIEIVKFSTSSYSAQLLLAATSAVEEGGLAFIQGNNVLTGEQDYTAIAGTPIIKQESSNLIKKQTAELSSDIKKYGLKEVVIDNEYIYSAAKAQEIADFLISKFNEPVPVLNIQSIAIPTLQIGDRIRISNLESLGIIDTDYWVVSHSLSVGDSLDHTITLRKVI